LLLQDALVREMCVVMPRVHKYVLVDGDPVMGVMEGVGGGGDEGCDMSLQ
jgi:hypothetical protein